ncbi:two-component regulator propeller domain-containing protein [Lacinutrix sp.]|uniref:ligand-binding sensor domain-containing protein n=1 Tax=Lacinutrix sp. TaxID=1937692 RepID=UPI0025C4C3B0|nr:two-component regulator propeller domain-containing protein [Lacinutrix sp.]
MKQSYMFLRTCLIVFIIAFITSCGGQGQSHSNKEDETIINKLSKNVDSQIGEYVIEIFQDSKNNIWFGTLEEGVAKFDGTNLKYLTTKDGLPSNRITSVIEDDLGNLWFGTGAGVSRFDGKIFTNFSEKDGLCSDMVSNLFIDKKGNFWIGTWDGVCKFNGTRFKKFPIPYPKIETKINPDTKNWITSISEDKKGNIWFGRDNYGASKFNGNSFVHFTTKEGLNSNNVQSIVEDNKGNIWIGTRVAEKDNLDTDRRFGIGGLNKYDGHKFINFPEIKGLNESDVYSIYNDNSNNLWISTTSKGVYNYTDNGFVNYKVPTSTIVFLKDIKENIWLGCAGGLYKIDKNGKTKNVTTNGPWN